MGRALRDSKGNSQRVLAAEMDYLPGKPDSYLFHEYHEDVNEPLYFHEFAARASGHGLQFLAEARPWDVTVDLAPDLRQELERLAPDRIAREQYYDFLRNQAFRRTLLCRTDVALRPEAAFAESLPHLRMKARARPENKSPDVRSAAPESFRIPDDEATISTSNPQLKATLVTLYESWPRSITFAELCRVTGERLFPDHPQDADAPEWRQQVAVVLRRCYEAHLVDLHLHEPPLVLTISDRPVACPVARLMAQRREIVPNLWHQLLELPEHERFILALLDGTRNHATLLQEMRAALADGLFEIKPNPEADEMHAALQEILRRLAINSLLIG